MSFSSEMQAVAIELIEEFGGSLVFVKPSPSATSTPWKAGGDDARSLITAMGVILPTSSLDENERSTLHKEAVAVCYVADAVVLASSELLYTAIKDGSSEYRIVRATSYRPNPSDVATLYVFQLAR